MVRVQRPWVRSRKRTVPKILVRKLICLELFCDDIYFLSEKAMAPHSSTLTWKIPWTEEPGRLQFIGSRRVRHD